ncbi:MAG: radical SAM protein, partial [Limnochordia bacterium]|nr:radical SAM protein [Limnochordia bacterium]
MGPIKRFVAKFAIRRAIGYAEKDPEVNVPKLLDWSERYARLDEHKYVINEIRKYWATPDNNWRQLILRAFEELDPEVRKRFMANFFVYSGLYGIPKGYEMVEKYDCNVPWTIL